MAQKFFKVPFATSGDVNDVPEDAQPDGSVSYSEGFGPDYQAASDDPDVLYPERPIINDLFFVITQALQILQVHGFPDFITSSDNDGSPYSYDINAFVRYNNKVYYSLENSNTDTPPSSKWAEFVQASPFKTGMTIIHEDTSLPDSTWVWANGQTIGDGSSGATGRANADTQALFYQIWAAFPNSVRPIQNSAGVPSTRGVSAAADFSAHKRIPLRDMRDVVPAGTGTMGGAADRGLLTAANTLGVDGTIFGATGGEQQHTPTLEETFPHTHDGSGMTTNTTGAHTHTVTSWRNGIEGSSIAGGQGTGSSNIQTTSLNGNHSHTITGSTGSTGSGNAFNVVQPTTICNFITKL